MMHIVPAMLIGFAAWILTIIFAAERLYAVGFGPLIVSGVALGACFLPLLLPVRLARKLASPGRR